MTTITPELLEEIRTVSENAAARNRMAAFWPTYSPQTMLALVAALEEAQRERDTLRAENEKLRAALERLGSPLAMEMNAGMIRDTEEGRELRARMFFADAALKETTHA